ncbi:solute carrier family 26 protein [Salipaludibacillus agaradhaerens]|uniref:SulP family inorganic anion transporter n=1 Tax=Salipaludibacillus agaradhaerens TaxID=76935 RepID=UPI00215103B1|nr:solute carrier family 26 protein [Salipaludibacillus agaradhaerens]MCR6118041.1 solute carrier family 26 protein [Salipaludibacillus agaradhaerens]
MFKKFVPAFEWLTAYKKTDLTGDMSAGLIVAIMLIPQGMAYAMLAGLPPVIGLYASTVPLIIYALFGTSRQLAVGPVAMVSLLVLTGVSTITDPGTSDYISLVLLLTLMIGVIQLLMGLFKLGFLVNFMSHAVISGFTSAAAIIIGLSQLKHLIGVSLEADKNVFLIMIETVNRLSEINPITLGIGLISIGLLLTLKKIVKRVPAPLIIVLLSTLTVYYFEWHQSGVSIVGNVPSGLPSLSLPVINVKALIQLLPIALTIAFVGFMESIAMAKAIAAKEKYKVMPNKELRGLGLANIGSSFFSGFPVTGGFSRSAVNYQSGARTPLATIITAIFIILTLIFFTEWFYYLPNAVLAAIIMVAVYSLIDFREVKQLLKINKVDGSVWLVTFLTTLIFGIVEGILIGIIYSLLIFVWRSAYPHVAELGYLQKEHVYRNIKRYPEVTTEQDILIFRFDSSLFFANISFYEEKLGKRLVDKSETKWVILDFSGVNSIDAVALHALEDMIEAQSHDHEVTFLFSGVKGPVKDLIIRAEWGEEYEKHIHYLSINHAHKTIKAGDIGA